MAAKKKVATNAPTENYEGFCAWVKTNIGEASDEVLRAWFDSIPAKTK